MAPASGGVKVLAIKSATTTVENENPSMIAESMVSPSTAMIEALPREILVEETPMKETPAIDMARPLKETLVMAIETRDPLELVVPLQCPPPAISQVGPSQSAPSAPSIAENLQTTTEFLKSFLSFGENNIWIKKGLNIESPAP